MKDTDIIKSMLLQDLRLSKGNDYFDNSQMLYDLIYLVKNSLLDNISPEGEKYNYDYFLKIRYYLYKQYQSKKGKYDRVLNTVLSEIEPGKSLKIIPKIEKYVDWTEVYPRYNKEKLIELLEIEKQFFIRACTGTSITEELENEFEKVKNELKTVLKKLGLKRPMDYDLWEWVSRDNLSMLGLESWSSRRIYISNQYKETIEIIEKSFYPTQGYHFYKPTPWEKIDDEVVKLAKKLDNISGKSDINSYSTVARELFIELGQIFFDPEIHYDLDDPEKYNRSKSKNILMKYVNDCYKGSNNKEIRKMIKASVDFSSKMVHSESANKEDARIIYSSVISIIDYMRIIWESQGEKNI